MLYETISFKIIKEELKFKVVRLLLNCLENNATDGHWLSIASMHSSQAQSLFNKY